MAYERARERSQLLPSKASKVSTQGRQNKEEDTTCDGAGRQDRKIRKYAKEEHTVSWYNNTYLLTGNYSISEEAINRTHLEDAVDAVDALLGRGGLPRLELREHELDDL